MYRAAATVWSLFVLSKELSEEDAVASWPISYGILGLIREQYANIDNVSMNRYR